MVLVFSDKLAKFLFMPKFGVALVGAPELLKLIRPVDRLDKFDVGPELLFCVDDDTGDVADMLTLGVFEPIIDEPNEKLPRPKLLLLLLFEMLALLLVCVCGGELVFDGDDDDGAPAFTVVATLLPGMVSKLGFCASCRRVARFCRFWLLFMFVFEFSFIELTELAAAAATAAKVTGLAPVTTLCSCGSDELSSCCTSNKLFKFEAFEFGPMGPLTLPPIVPLAFEALLLLVGLFVFKLKPPIRFFVC